MTVTFPEVKDAVFTVQILKEGKTTNREISYTEVNKLAERAAAKAGKMPGRVSIGLVIGYRCGRRCDSHCLYQK